MLLVDSSVWISHFRHRGAALSAALDAGTVVTHPFVIGELACGGLKNRTQILTLLGQLPSVETAEHDEVMHLVRAHKLAGSGVGWVDVHILASARISGASLWTHDKALERAWQRVSRR